MPEIGEIKRGNEIGYDSGNKFIWHACMDCGRERWVIMREGQPKNLRCHTCARKARTGSDSPRWKGGQGYSRGYVYILRPEHPRANKRGYVKRAILILEEKLGRYLLPGKLSHHINGIRDDDRPENLMEMTRSKHMVLHRKGG